MKHSMQASFPYILALVLVLFGGSVVNASQTGRYNDVESAIVSFTKLMKDYYESTDKNKRNEVARQINELYQNNTQLMNAESHGGQGGIDKFVRRDPQPAKAAAEAQVFHILKGLPNSAALAKALEDIKTQINSPGFISLPKEEKARLNILNEHLGGMIPFLQALEKEDEEQKTDQSTISTEKSWCITPLQGIGGALLLAATAYGLLKLYRWYKQAPSEQEQEATPDDSQATTTNTQSTTPLNHHHKKGVSPYET